MNPTSFAHSLYFQGRLAITPPATDTTVIDVKTAHPTDFPEAQVIVRGANAFLYPKPGSNKPVVGMVQKDGKKDYFVAMGKSDDELRQLCVQA